MMKIEEGYWLKGVKLTTMRGQLILYIIDLMDGLYQERAWIEEAKYPGEKSFINELESCVEYFEMQNVFDRLEEGKDAYDAIGWFLKTKKEAEILLESGKPLDYIYMNYSYNKEFLSIKELYDMREVSLEAFGVFMENERENEDFCKFIVEVMLEQKRINAEEIAGKTAYESILFYMGKCLKQNKQIRQERGF